MVGPKIQKDLFSILVRFRLHQVALSADIAKMYRQVELDKEDKDYHRLLWKDPNSEAIETYRMTRVTYGIASSSFHSIRPLQVLAEETTNTKLRLSLTDMYVDDLLTGCEDSEAAEKLQDAIITLLASAGFDIRKWVSSDSKLVSRLAATFRETEDEKIIESEDYAIKTLGIRWNPNPDQFGFTVKLDKGTPFTKRQILSEVSRLFDPLGWLSPTTIQHKSFVQLLWMDKLSWDQPLLDPILQQYLRLRAQLKDLEKISPQRKVLKPATKSDLQLHVFCDASTTAYAAVVFIRQETDNFIETKMLTAKTRVAPIKSVSEPRLELCAALLGAKLVEAVTNAISDERFPTPKVFAWSDSTVTIAWLQDYPRKWKTFVANRVAKIQEIIPASSWKYVATEDNPADCASRGLAAADLMSHKLWWDGPEWLRQPENAWPSLDILSPTGEETKKEVKVQSENVKMISSKEDYAIFLMINRHSSIHKVTRIFTYVQKFSSIRRRIQSSKAKQRTTKMSNSIKACSSTPNERTDSNESTSQPMIWTYNSVSLQGKDLYEGQLQLYSFIQRNFLHEYKIIMNQPTEDANNSSRDATKQYVQQRIKSTGPEGVGGIGRAGGPGAYINTRIGKGTGISLVTNGPQHLGRTGGPGCLVSAKGADENWSSSSAGTPEVIGRAGGPGSLSLVSAGSADDNVSTTNSLGIGRAGGPGSLVSAGDAGENASSVSITNSLGIGRAGGPGCHDSVEAVGVSRDDVRHGIGRAGGPGAYINTRIGKGTGISLVTNGPQHLGRTGGPGCLVSAKGADENWSSSSAGTPEVIGRAGGPGSLSLVSAGSADDNVSTTNSLGIGRAGGPGSLVSAGDAGENASSVSITNSLGIGRAGGPGCHDSVEAVGVSRDDVRHGIGWAGGPGDQLYIVSTGNTDNSSETAHQFNKDDTREKNVSLTPMQQPLKGDTEDENFLEAAVSTAFHHFLMKKIK